MQRGYPEMLIRSTENRKVTGSTPVGATKMRPPQCLRGAHRFNQKCRSTPTAPRRRRTRWYTQRYTHGDLRGSSPRHADPSSCHGLPHPSRSSPTDAPAHADTYARGMDDPRRWTGLPGKHTHLPPLPTCPHCGDRWIGEGMIGPLADVLVCECTPSEQHTAWHCWRCHAVLAEGCVDTSQWWDVPVNCPARLGQADIEERL